MSINQISGGATSIPAVGATVDVGAGNRVNLKSTTQKLTAPVKTELEVSDADLKKSVEMINRMMNANNGVNFNIDQGSGRMVVQVVDRETNTVIRQIPSKEVIEISKDLESKAGLLLRDQA